MKVTIDSWRLGAPGAGETLTVGSVFTAAALTLLVGHTIQVVARRKRQWTDQHARERQR